MSALELVQAVHHATWLVLSVIATARVIRRPTRANLDVALFFGAIALFVIQARVLAFIDVPFEPEIGKAGTIAVLAVPYLLLRVIRDLTSVRWWIVRATEASVAVSALLVLIYPTPLPPAALLYIGVAFAAATTFAAVRSVRLASRATGVTRRRMQAVALGSYFLGAAILVAVLAALVPPVAGMAGSLTQVLAAACALAYFAGFAPPNALRRFWQAPELRVFLGQASTLPRMTMDDIVRDLEAAAGTALGVRATIGLYDEAAGVLRFRDPHGALPREVGPSRFLAWRVFASQTPLYEPDVAAAHPEHAERNREARVRTVLIAPITAGERRLGVLEVYAAREPIFAEDDLAFVELMARQAAVLLESRALIDAAAAARAHEETARLKEDFVSAAAHDLKTPLTTIVGQAQLLERRAAREGRTAELEGLRRLVRESLQLSRLVEELLDASRIERGALEAHLEECDLADVARKVAARERPGRERIELSAPTPLRGLFDRERMRQVLENLVENALKYSPPGSPVEVRVEAGEGTALIAVTDRGIGIPVEDQPYIFDRFRRGSNVDHRRFSGIGLGLYICRGIVEQHRGTISAESFPGRGTTFHVALPLDPASAAVAAEVKGASAAIAS